MLSFLIILLIFNGCSKSGSGPNNGGGTGGGNNGGGGGNNNGGSAVTITSVTPVNPYPDDEITINGTGFNADATKDTVEFGQLTNNVFGAWHDGIETEWAGLCTVISATTTQLKVKAVNTWKLDFYSFPNGTTSIAALQVRTTGKKAVSPVIPFKRLLFLQGIFNPDYFNWSIGRPSDSLVISGKGFRKSGVQASVDGKLLTNFTIDSAAGNITLRLPKTFFGTENDESIMEDKVLTLSNPDGKIVTKSFKFLISPQMRINSMQPTPSTISLSSGGNVNILVNGRNLKNDATVHVDGVTIHSQTGLQVNNFPDNTTINLTAGALAPGNIQVSIYRGNVLYGLCNITVTQ